MKRPRIRDLSFVGRLVLEISKCYVYLSWPLDFAFGHFLFCVVHNN